MQAFEYDLPSTCIAQVPAEPRDSARLLVDRGASHAPEHRSVARPASPARAGGRARRQRHPRDPGAPPRAPRDRWQRRGVPRPSPRGRRLARVGTAGSAPGRGGGAALCAPGRRRVRGRGRGAARRHRRSSGATACRRSGRSPRSARHDATAAVHPHAVARSRAVSDGLRITAGICCRANRRAAPHPGAAAAMPGEADPGVHGRARRRPRHLPPGRRRSTRGPRDPP